MRSEAELRAELAFVDEQDVPEALALGLADRALARAGRQTWQRRSAVGGAVAVLAVAGVVVATVQPWSQGLDEVGPTYVGPVSPETRTWALVHYTSSCAPLGTRNGGLTNYTWDNTSQRYIPSGPDSSFSALPSPDGSKALLAWGDIWRVVPWKDAATATSAGARHLPGDTHDLAWSPDGLYLMDKRWDSNVVDPNTTPTEVNFYDPVTWAKTAVIVPTAVLDLTDRGWKLSGWDGGKDDLRFIVVSVNTGEVRLIDQKGKTVRDFALPPSVLGGASGWPPEIRFSPDDRYVFTQPDRQNRVFDLASGAAVEVYHSKPSTETDLEYILGWTPDGNLYEERWTQGSPTQLRLLQPTGGVLSSFEIVKPGDKTYSCGLNDESFAPSSQFPGATAL